MAIPTWFGNGTASNAATAASPPWPTSHQSGDIGLMFVETANENVNTIPTGWSSVTSLGVGVSGTMLTVLWSRATSAAQPTLSIGDSGNHNFAMIVGFRGCIETGDPWDIVAGNTESGTVSNVTIPGGTTTVDDTLVVVAASSSLDTATNQMVTLWKNSSLAGVTSRAQNYNITQNGGGFTVVTGGCPAAGTVSSSTGTFNGAASQARIMIALKPPQAQNGVFIPTSIGSAADFTDRSSYTISVNRAPGTDTVVLVAAQADLSTGASDPSACSGCGMVFSLVTSVVSYSGVRTLSVWRGMATSRVSSVITVVYPSVQAAFTGMVIEVSGVSTSGTSGSGAIGKSATSQNVGNSALTTHVPSATSTANCWIYMGGLDGTGADPVKPSFTTIDRATLGTPHFTGLLSAWTTLSTATLAEQSGQGVRSRGGTMIELVLDNPPGGGGGAVPGGYYHHYYSHVVVGAA